MSWEFTTNVDMTTHNQDKGLIEWCSVDLSWEISIPSDTFKMTRGGLMYEQFLDAYFNTGRLLFFLYVASIDRE